MPRQPRLGDALGIGDQNQDWLAGSEARNQAARWNPQSESVENSRLAAGGALTRALNNRPAPAPALAQDPELADDVGQLRRALGGDAGVRRMRQGHDTFMVSSPSGGGMGLLMGGRAAAERLSPTPAPAVSKPARTIYRGMVDESQAGENLDPEQRALRQTIGNAAMWAKVDKEKFNAASQRRAAVDQQRRDAVAARGIERAQGRELRQPGVLASRLLGEGGAEDGDVPAWLNMQANMGNPQALQLRERITAAREEARNRNKGTELTERRIALEEEQNKVARDQLTEARERQQYDLDTAVANDETQPFAVREAARRRAAEYVNKQYPTNAPAPQSPTSTATSNPAPAAGSSPPPESAVRYGKLGQMLTNDLEKEQYLSSEYRITPQASNELLTASREDRPAILRKYGIPESEWPRINIFLNSKGRAMTRDNVAEYERRTKERGTPQTTMEAWNLAPSW
jgi:hypothetical protein